VMHIAYWKRARHDERAEAGGEGLSRQEGSTDLGGESRWLTARTLTGGVVQEIRIRGPCCTARCEDRTGLTFRMATSSFGATHRRNAGESTATPDN